MSEVAPHDVTFTVLWAGGWDTYLIDLNETTDAPPTTYEGKWWEHHPNQTFSANGKLWLSARALNHSWYDDRVLEARPEKGCGVHPDTKGVRIIRHVGGGD